MESYSVLMSVYYKETADNLHQAINSMLTQTISPEDFVLVCDGQLTPELDAVVSEYENKYPELFQVIRFPENRGLGVALREGMKACRFELVARMDADDISVPDRMEKQLAVMREHPDAAVVGGQISEFSGDPENVIGYRMVPLTPEAIRREAKFRCTVNHMTVLLKKSDVLAAGGYQEFLLYEDYQLWARLWAGGYKFYNVEDICCHARVDETFYGRRGGMDYFLKTVKMQQYLRSCGLINGWEYWRNILLRFMGTVLLPEKIRGKVFVKAMRKNKMSV